MRQSLLVLLATAAIVSATGTGCAQRNIDDLVTKTSCGCPKSITKCLRRVDLDRVEEIEKCYLKGGCEESDAALGAMWFAKECHEELADEKDDLRRRADTTSASETTTESDSTTAKTTAKTTSATTTAKTTAKTTSTPSSAAASTTTDSTTSSDSTTSASSTTVSSTTSDSTTSSTTSASTTTATPLTVGTLTCSVTTTKSTSMCFVDNAGRTESCVPTVTAIGSCAPGLICFASSAATPATCMKKDNSLTTSGLVVTIAFATGILVTIIAVTVLQIRGRQKQRRLAHQAALAAAAAGKRRAGSDVESANAFSQARRAQGMQSEANLPLIGNEQQQYYNQPEYAAQGPPAPRIHQGLGALGQEPRY